MCVSVCVSCRALHDCMRGGGVVEKSSKRSSHVRPSSHVARLLYIERERPLGAAPPPEPDDAIDFKLESMAF